MTPGTGSNSALSPIGTSFLALLWSYMVKQTVGFAQKLTVLRTWDILEPSHLERNPHDITAFRRCLHLPRTCGAYMFRPAPPPRAWLPRCSPPTVHSGDHVLVSCPVVASHLRVGYCRAAFRLTPRSRARRDFKATPVPTWCFHAVGLPC